MATTGEQAAETILHDLACPQCEYNLRGLSGAVVSCPECGERCDIAELMTRKWTKPWHKAPGLTLLAVPCAWAVGSLFIMGPVMLAIMDMTAGTASAAFVVPAFCIFVWIALMIWTSRKFGTAAGPWLAMLAHVIVAVYLIAFLAMVSGTVATIAQYFDGAYGMAMGAGAVVVVSVLFMVAARHGERYMAKHCIRRWLAKRGVKD